MEQQGVTNSGGGGGRKKNQGSISIERGGGGGIAGLLVFGGALAVTGLIAVASFASKRNKGKGRPHQDKSPLSGTLPQESDDTTQGLPSRLQDSTANDDIDNTRFESSNSTMDHIDSYEIIPSQTLVLEEKLDLKVKTNEEEESATSLHQEIVCDDSSPESAASSNENGVVEESLESSCDSPCFKTQEKVENIGSQESLKSFQVNEGQYENATTEAEEIEDDVVGNNDEEEEEEEVAFETSENSSEESGRTSLDSSEAAIWPAELIEEPQREVKRGMVNDQSESEGTAKTNVSDSCVGNEGDRCSFEVSEYGGKAMTSEARACEKSNLYMALSHQLCLSVSRSSNSRTWIISMLLLALLLLLLLLLLTHHIPASLYVLDVDGGDSVISP